MDYDYKAKTNIASILLMFAILTIVSVLLSSIYILLVGSILDVYFSVIIAVAYGLILSWLVRSLFHKLKITNKFLGFIFVIFALAIGMYFKWCLWLAYQSIYVITLDFNLFKDMKDILDLTFYYLSHPMDAWYNIEIFNEFGTWTYDNMEVNGILLTLIWVIEAILMNLFALFACFNNSEIFIAESNAWAVARYSWGVYQHLDYSELEDIKAFGFEAILNKPTISSEYQTAKKSYRLAFLTVDNQYTGHVAIYTTHAKNKIKQKIKGKPLFIGKEEAEELYNLLEEKFSLKVDPEDNIDIESNSSNPNLQDSQVDKTQSNFSAYNNKNLNDFEDIDDNEDDGDDE